VPPVATRAAEYAAARVPFGSEAVVILSAGAIDRVSDLEAVTAFASLR
jgi:hypothetical protein